MATVGPSAAVVAVAHGDDRRGRRRPAGARALAGAWPQLGQGNGEGWRRPAAARGQRSRLLAAAFVRGRARRVGSIQIGKGGRGIRGSVGIGLGFRGEIRGMGAAGWASGGGRLGLAWWPARSAQPGKAFFPFFSFRFCFSLFPFLYIYFLLIYNLF